MHLKTQTKEKHASEKLQNLANRHQQLGNNIVPRLRHPQALDFSMPIQAYRQANTLHVCYGNRMFQFDNYHNNKSTTTTDATILISTCTIATSTEVYNNQKPTTIQYQNLSQQKIVEEI